MSNLKSRYFSYLEIFMSYIKLLSFYNIVILAHNNEKYYT